MTRAKVELPLSASAIADVIGRALEAAGAPSPGSVTVVLTDDTELAELNAEHMGVDCPTDVLSFPMLPPDTFVGDGAPTGPSAGHRPRSVVGGVARRRTHLGDIAISVERAVGQAEEGRGGQTGDIRWSAADELRLLVTHGTLHLCGRDHAGPAEEAAMRSVERRLLETNR